jgi:hypothetical protein
MRREEYSISESLIKRVSVRGGIRREKINIHYRGGRGEIGEIVFVILFCVVGTVWDELGVGKGMRNSQGKVESVVWEMGRGRHGGPSGGGA